MQDIPNFITDNNTQIISARDALEECAINIETSAEYTNADHPFHNSAVSYLNKMLSMLLELDRMIIEDNE